ncbi:MAG: DEAD/DEAH box helicase [Pseudomonadota bacterium]
MTDSTNDAVDERTNLTDFESLGLSPRLLNTLRKQGLTTPTPIQTQAIPHVLDGRDLMGLAQTGTGKTAAFGLPLVHMQMKRGTRPEPKTATTLILAPTRELAKQIADNLRGFVMGSHLKITMVVGGNSLNMQAKQLARGTDLLVATPGRLIDHLERRSLTLSETRYFVLDEADQMLDMGFIHALRQIAKLLPTERQTLLFSATMPKLMAEISASYLNDPVRVEVAPPGKVADKITQELHYVAQGDKGALLRKMLATHPEERALVFMRTKHGAERLMRQLDRDGFAAGSIHGNKSQGQRDRALKAFRDGSSKVLVATDVAARGIDIPGVRHVYNFDLPNVPENYVHRIGRTARAGADGTAYAFCAEAEMSMLWDIEKVMGFAIPPVSGTAWAAAPVKGRRGGGGNGARPPKPGAKPRGRSSRRRSGGGRKAA